MFLTLWEGLFVDVHGHVESSAYSKSGMWDQLKHFLVWVKFVDCLKGARVDFAPAFAPN